MKELLKSVHVCQSYRKNKSGTFYGPRCVFPVDSRPGHWTLIRHNRKSIPDFRLHRK